MKNLFKIKENFLEEFFVRFIYLFLIILGIAITFVVFDRYYVFLKLLPCFLLTLIVFVLLFIYFNEGKIDFKKDKIDYLIVLSILIFCTLNAFHFSEYLIEGGHDQGGYFETALLLSKTGHYYENYSERPISLDIPGYMLYENNLTRWHFIPGGSTYFSIFHRLFGLNGFPIALSFSLFFSMSIIYFLCKRIRNWKTGLFFLPFFIFNYYTLYFSRATWVENIQLLLVWFYVYLFFVGYQTKNKNYFLYASLPVSLLIFFRLEAILYISVYVVLSSYFLFFKRNNFKFNKGSLPALIFIVFFSILMIANIFIFDSNTILFDEESTIHSIIKTIKNPAADIAWGPKEVIPYNQQIFQWVFLLYLFGLPFILIFLLSIFNFFTEDKETQKTIILISFLILPQFIFLLRPSIQLYVPWAMRRFWGVFVPYAFILFSLSLTNKKSLIRPHHNRLFIFFIVLIFILNSLPAFSVLNLAEGNGILDYEKQVASNFNKTDLVIFWDRYIYEKWGPPLYFLHGTSVVFDQSPAFDKEIYALFMRNYKDIYIATSRKPDEELYHPYFEGNVTYQKTIESSTFKILADSPCHLGGFCVQPETFKGYYQIKELCAVNNPPIKVSDYKISLNIYKINTSFKEQFIEENYDPSYKITKETQNIWH